VVCVRPLPDGGYAIDTERTGSWRSRRRGPVGRTFTAEHVLFAAGTYGTQRLLHEMKANGVLPRISDRLGLLTRTNSEALCAASVTLRHRELHDFTKGIAITSSIHPDDVTHIEPVRYGKGTQSMGLLSTVMTDGGGSVPRWLRWIGQVVRHPGQVLSVYAGLGSWSRRTVIGLVMQSRDNSITVSAKRTRSGRIKLTSQQGHGVPTPTWIPVANEAMRRLAKRIGGKPYSTLGEILDIPMTAHLLGGCSIGDSAETGVIDPYQRMYGHAGLHVVDGAAVSANLGVNPALTITAQAERAMAQWPNKGEEDPRPALGETYRRLRPTPPHNPAVPPHAPAALRVSEGE